MNILLLGGTGVMGEVMLPMLSELSHSLTVTSRVSRVGNASVRYVKGNAHNLGFLKEIISSANWDCVIDFMVYTTEEFEERIELLLNSTNQYVFLSSSRVYADENTPLKESSNRLLDVSNDLTFLNTDEYPLSKARQENILFKCKLTNWTIIRPYITYADNRLQLLVFEKEGWLYRALKGRHIVLPKELMNKYTTMTSGEDVARAIVSILGRDEAFSRVFHITNPTPVKWKDVLNIYLDGFELTCGSRPKVKYQSLNDFYKYNSKFPVEYDRNYNRVFDNSNISQFINVDSFLDISQDLKCKLCDFLKEPGFKNINWKAEAYKDRAASEHTPLFEINGIKNKLKYVVFRYLAN